MSAAEAPNQNLPRALTRKERADIIASVKRAQMRTDLPQLNPGDTVKVHAKIVEGNKERVQIFEGVIIEQQGTNGPEATFTVRKISYNVGVERKFLLHSPRIEKIEVISRGDVRRAKLYYLRNMKGKAGRVKSRYEAGTQQEAAGAASASSSTQPPGAESSSAEQASA